MSAVLLLGSLFFLVIFAVSSVALVARLRKGGLSLEGCLAFAKVAGKSLAFAFLLLSSTGLLDVSLQRGKGFLMSFMFSLLVAVCFLLPVLFVWAVVNQVRIGIWERRVRSASNPLRSASLRNQGVYPKLLETRRFHIAAIALCMVVAVLASFIAVR